MHPIFELNVFYNTYLMYNSFMSNFNFSIKNTGSKIIVKLSGRLDERAILKPIETASGTVLEIDLGELGSLNSNGIRLWILWAHGLEEAVEVSLVHCPSNFLSMAGLLKNALPNRFNIRSISVPYFCEKCEQAFNTPLELKKSQRPESIPEHALCPKCGIEANLDMEPDIFFRFLEK
jgi:hypothetical protein